MKFVKYDTIDAFMQETFIFLSSYELQNNLIIGNCLPAKENNQNTTSFF